MKYDLFTNDEALAEKITDLTGRAYLVDTTEMPDIYQFFQLNDNQLMRIILQMKGIHSKIEIRDSKTGEYVWPVDPSGKTSRQALTLMDIISMN